MKGNSWSKGAYKKEDHKYYTKFTFSGHPTGGFEDKFKPSLHPR
jgi:hypothetical protein